MFKCHKLKATNVSVGVYHMIKTWKIREDQEEICKSKKIRLESGLIFKYKLKSIKACGLSAKDRGATKNLVSDLELNLSKTAKKAIEFWSVGQ